MEEDSDDVDMEVITTETRIKPTNKGFALLTKLGWSDGQPLGLSGEGRVDPIPFHFKADATGLGKISQDVEMVEATVSQRRELDSERFSRQTLEQKEARLVGSLLNLSFCPPHPVLSTTQLDVPSLMQKFPRHYGHSIAHSATSSSNMWPNTTSTRIHTPIITKLD